MPSMASPDNPLRRIVSVDALYHYLECGHRLSSHENAAIYRRRCHKCRLGRPADPPSIPPVVVVADRLISPLTAGDDPYMPDRSLCGGRHYGGGCG